MTTQNKEYQSIINKIRHFFDAKENEFIPLHAPNFKGNEKKYLNECIDSTFVSSVGPFVDRIENDICNYTGSKFAIACSNGTSALHIALKLSNVEQGDLVITQPFSFIATVNAISYCGGIPVFVDIDEHTLSLSPQKLKIFLENECEISNNSCIHIKTQKKIKACVPMHTFGFCADMDEINRICNDYRIAVVEDAAESLGSYYKGKHSGIFGKFGTISFNGNKTITAGGGGVILCQDENLANMAKHLTTQAKVPHAWEFFHDQIGYNYRMPNLNAALLCAQLEQIDQFLAEKRALTKQYEHLFSQYANLKFLTEPENQHSNYWLCSVLFPNKEERDTFLKMANDQKTMCRPGWELLFTLPMFENHCVMTDCSTAIDIQSRLVNIPSSPYYPRL
jgi:perosamine synthetase